MVLPECGAREFCEEWVLYSTARHGNAQIGTIVLANYWHICQFVCTRTPSFQGQKKIIRSQHRRWERGRARHHVKNIKSMPRALCITIIWPWRTIRTTSDHGF